jgi:hypothetical protein
MRCKGKHELEPNAGVGNSVATVLIANAVEHDIGCAPFDPAAEFDAAWTWLDVIPMAAC